MEALDKNDLPPLVEAFVCPLCEGAGKVPVPSSLIDRVIAKTEVNGDCWEYRGSLTGGHHRRGKIEQGYPSFTWRNYKWLLHRLSYLIFNGTLNLPFVRHHCDNPLCWRPDHLAEGTVQSNNQDRKDRGRYIGPRGERNHWATVTDELVLEMRRLARDEDGGKPTRARARQFGLSHGQYSRIIHGFSWVHLPGAIPPRIRQPSRPVTAFGETKSIRDWQRDPRCSIAYGALVGRLLRRDQWPSVEAAITTPHISGRKRIPTITEPGDSETTGKD